MATEPVCQALSPAGQWPERHRYSYGVRSLYCLVTANWQGVMAGRGPLCGVRADTDRRISAGGVWPGAVPQASGREGFPSSGLLL